MSPKTAKKHSILIDDAVTSSSAAICAEDSMQATVNLIPADATASDFHPKDPSLITVADDQAPRCDTDERPMDGVADNSITSADHSNAGGYVDGLATTTCAADALAEGAESSDLISVLARREPTVPELEFTIDTASGEFQLHVNGIAGRACDDVAKLVKELLGNPGPRRGDRRIPPASRRPHTISSQRSGKTCLNSYGSSTPARVTSQSKASALTKLCHSLATSFHLLESSTAPDRWRLCRFRGLA